MRPLAALLVLAALALLPSSAFAARVRCGQVIAQSTRVDNDLRNCPGDGLVIGAHNIELDLNGHTIDGDADPLDDDIPDVYGVNNSAGFDGVRVVDGTLQQFDGGVFLLGADGNQLTRLVANGGGFNLRDSRHNRIEKSTMRGAIRLDRGADYNTVRRTRLFEEIFINDGRNNRVLANRFSLSGCSTPGSGAPYGVFVAGQGNLIKGNLITCAWEGVRVGSDHNRIQQNVITNSIKSGINVGTVGNVIKANVVARNGHGILGGAGILVQLGSPLTVLVGNIATENGLRHRSGINDGIHVDDPSTTLRANRAYRNFDLGIEAVSGVIDGGRNRARGNGNPLQCLNVFCRP